MKRPKRHLKLVGKWGKTGWELSSADGEFLSPCGQNKIPWCMLILGLSGKTELDKAQADMLVDCFQDATNPAFVIFHETDDIKKV